MSEVKSISTHSERPWSGGLVKRRYEITLTDELGVEHISITMPVKQAPDGDGVEIGDKYLASLKGIELSQYKSNITEGINPFLGDSLWNTKLELLKPVLDDALTLPALDPYVRNGLPLFALVTDAEIMALYSQDQTFVDSIRLKASTLASQLLALDSYVPEVL